MANQVIEIIPTAVIRSADDLSACSRVAAYAKWVHIDVDDGIFAPVVSWPYTKKGVFDEPQLSQVRGVNVEVHLMVSDERAIGLSFARAGGKRIVGHVESFENTEAAHGALDVWRSAGAEVGLSILLDTPLALLDPLISACDFVQVMSVATIGLQGAPFDARSIPRIAELREKYPELLLSVDGGVSLSNIAQLACAGARRFSVGSALSKSADPAAAYAALLDAAEEVIQ